MLTLDKDTTDLKGLARAIEEILTHRKLTLIFVDEKPALVTKTQLTGAEIKNAGGVPGDDHLYLDNPCGEDCQVTNDQVIEVKNGYRFNGVPIGNLGHMSRFEADVAQLVREGWAVEAQAVGGESIVVFRRFPVPAGWTRREADVLVKVPPAYPQGGLDMFWTPPDLKLDGGRAPNGTSVEVVNGAQWQRFSWHPRSWNPGRDSLVTYVKFIQNRLAMLN